MITPTDYLTCLQITCYTCSFGEECNYDFDICEKAKKFEKES